MPYYRDLFRQIGFQPEKVVHDHRYFLDLPFLTKDIIREQGDRLLNEAIPKAEMIERKTGASTGPSTLIYYSREALDWTAAVNLFCLEGAGKTRVKKEVHLASRFPEAFPVKDRFREMVKCAALNRSNIFTDSLDDENLERIWRRLRRFKPFLLQGHPSTTYALARFVMLRGYDTSGVLQVFESTGELLDEKKRRTIEEAFKCRVINRYGNAELGIVAYEQNHDYRRWMKVMDFIAWPEISKDADGADELILTGLTNPGMPLIRYRSGDLGELVTEPDGVYLKKVTGRVHDVVRIGNRAYPTHYIQDLLDKMGGIVEFQIEQTAEVEIRLRLVLEASAPEKEIADRVSQWWGDKVGVDFVNISDLKRRGRLGKFHYLIRADRNDGPEQDPDACPIR